MRNAVYNRKNDKMHRIDKIIKDESFIKRIKEINEIEKYRIFCGHGYDHLMSVARIAYIMVLEEGLDISKEFVYAASLLHDIGRFSEYEKEMDHRIAGPYVARPILLNAGFSEEETEIICDAIRLHGTYPDEKGTLAGVLYRADKLSRDCFSCKAYEECNWPPEKKNDYIKV